MAKIRVYELARQLNTTNIELMEKLKELNISVKSHMSAVDEQAMGLVKDVMFGAKSEVVVERRVKDTVIIHGRCWKRKRKILSLK